MTDETVDAVSSDPLKSVADALDAAVEATKDGVAQATASVGNALPAVGGFLTGLTYKTCYAVSYGVVFPAALVARAVPKENAAVHGFIDGARAAMDLVDEMKHRSQTGG
ncbi:hypothetical protein [Paludisphaera mucosa]|uniref:Uncharacterized protein n=1 Tax=Paludisphaera mucosa TaxID=3030827 RepID=A0ABT6FHV1_9BACT|nr:hypothetical protein [Paludisphaera mucosa]MDG3007094.1 hypothetical protein [Paludisphaera mucosa]